MVARKAKRSAPRAGVADGESSPALRRLVVRLSSDLKRRLLARVKEDQYGEKGVSRWIREALPVMLAQDRALDLVGQGDRLDGLYDDNVVLTVPPGVAVEIRDIALDLRERDLMVEGPQSRLVRSVIRFRLSHPDLPYAKPSSSRSPRRRKAREGRKEMTG